MKLTRIQKTKFSAVCSLGYQVIALVCGLVIPRMMISAFGSEAYGATTSITQFLAYITLLEGGIGGVGRAALYKPLAENDQEKVGAILYAIKRFFNFIALIFLIYTLVLAVVFKKIADLQSFDWWFTFGLVLVISISTLGQYFFGTANMIFLQADQKSYLGSILSGATSLLNALMIVLLINLNCNILVVKLVSSFVFILRPIVLAVYVKKKYQLPVPKQHDKNVLSQRWEGMGQHIAYFLHTNTDVVVLTLLLDLKAVAVYSVYSLVISSIRNVIVALTDGMEALFGDMIAKNEKKELHESVSFYELMIGMIAAALFSVTMVMIVPFVRLYTSGVNDVNYIQPLFALLLIGGEMIYCLRIPYHNLVIAAGHFKQTRFAAYGEAALNILISLILVKPLGLLGVAIGTFVSFGFRFVYYAIYLTRQILERKVKVFVKRQLINMLGISIVYFLGMLLEKAVDLSSVLNWVLFGFLMVAIAVVAVVAVNLLFYRRDTVRLIKKTLGRLVCKKEKRSKSC